MKNALVGQLHDLQAIATEVCGCATRSFQMAPPTARAPYGMSSGHYIATECTLLERPREPSPDEPSGPPPDTLDPLPRFDLNKLPVDTTKTPIKARIDTAPAATCPGLSTCSTGNALVHKG